MLDGSDRFITLRYSSTVRRGFYSVFPLTAPTIKSSPDFTVPPTKLVNDNLDVCALTFGDYNVSSSLSALFVNIPTNR